MKMLRSSSGMTLIEIMIVLVILGGLMALLSGQFTGQLQKSKVSTTKIQFGELSKSIQQYQLDCGSLPSTSEGLQALVQGGGSCQNWGPTPYAKKNLLVDPWGNDIMYERNSSVSFTLLSYGADGEPGGDGLDADISSEDL